VSEISTKRESSRSAHGGRRDEERNLKLRTKTFLAPRNSPSMGFHGAFAAMKGTSSPSKTTKSAGECLSPQPTRPTTQASCGMAERKSPTLPPCHSTRGQLTPDYRVEAPTTKGEEQAAAAAVESSDDLTGCDGSDPAGSDESAESNPLEAACVIGLGMTCLVAPIVVLPALWHVLVAIIATLWENIATLAAMIFAALLLWLTLRHVRLPARLRYRSFKKPLKKSASESSLHELAKSYQHATLLARHAAPMELRALPSFPTLLLRCICWLHNVMGPTLREVLTEWQMAAMVCLAPAQFNIGGRPEARGTLHFSVARWGQDWHGLKPSVGAIQATISRIVSDDEISFSQGSFKVKDDCSLHSECQSCLYLACTTAYVGSVNLITLQFAQESDEVVAYARSYTTSWVPVWMPLAPLLALLTCCFPIGDRSTNDAHLRFICDAVNQEQSFSASLHLRDDSGSVRDAECDSEATGRAQTPHLGLDDDSHLDYIGGSDSSQGQEPRGRSSSFRSTFS